MTSPIRVAGKYGRREPKNAPAIQFRDIMRPGAVIPPHPASEDYLARLSNWQMLGNDSAGDCVSVTWANMRRLVTSFLSTENYPTQDQVWAIYATQNPQFDPNGDPNVNGPGSPADGGMDIQTLLEYLVSTGGPDGVRAVAFAKVDFTNTDELDAALAVFGGVWTGLTVTAANQQEFAAGQPWTFDPNSPVDGGHSVVSGGFSTASVRFITWAEETDFTWAFVDNQVQEAWIVVWPENLGTVQFEAGIDETALATAYQELTGQTLPLPPTPVPPTPVPTPPGPTPVPPTPTPGPDAASQAFAAILRKDNWVHHHHIGDTHHVAVAARAWLEAEGL